MPLSSFEKGDVHICLVGYLFKKQTLEAKQVKVPQNHRDGIFKKTKLKSG